MDRWIGKVALVTGASAGMGAAIAERLAMLGMQVFGCARNIKPIEELRVKLKAKADCKGSLVALHCDLTQESQIIGMFSDIKETAGGVDVCVNNAGLSHKAPLVDGETEKWRNILEVNVLAPSITARETIASLKERNLDHGHIIHINSISGHEVAPADAHFYSASKYAITALTEGLRVELHQMKSQIRVSVS
ncbi:hypothetical protein CAPTEDRAFT_138195 [Capitella teleta]|uniref:Dehydrogenase/reductase SDR family member 11 n=1 Tax=Capitella teleta TaxID=283909 RepID=R7TP09_CAPTE|nr:hypothetical protein CAPTEDRAFT_138195 [Capitella teleta]|eukprot:ELT95633.1 hypothetical protein CAPTEDRAFT_138195 [Capitella teleta]